MAKRKTPVPKSGRENEEKAKNDFVLGAESNEKGKKSSYMPYSQRKTKGRSIGMTDNFYQSVKDFVKEHPEIGNISQVTVRALSDFMANYQKQK